MYQSPIEITRTVDDIVTKISEKQDETIVHACMRVGVDVDKDELLKALAYDRDQYEKGYIDGRWARDSEIVRCKDCKHWMDIDNGRQKHEMCAQLVPEWYCADGKRKETEDDKIY